MGINQRSADQPCAGGVVEMRTKIVAIRGVDFSRFIHREMDGAAFGTVCADRRAATGLPPRLPIRDGTVSLDAERDAFEAKRRVLLELVAFVNGGPSLEQRDILDVLTIALEVIDRAPPPPERAPLDPANPESVHSDMMWTHVSLGYELLLRLLYHPRMTKAALQPLLNKPRLRGLLARFMTSDARERDYVKTAVFRAYAILVGRRMFIRRHIRTLLTNFVATESEKCAAVLGVRPSSVSDTPAVTAFFGTIPLLGEVIEFCCSIAAGLNVPLKAEHKAFLRDNLLPLHTCSAYPTCVLSAACCVCVCWSQGRRRRTRPLRWRSGSRSLCVSLCVPLHVPWAGPQCRTLTARRPHARLSPLPPSPPFLPACSYAEPLRICVVVYLQKAPEMLNDVLRYLIKRWPKCGSSKQSVMIETLEIILVEMQAIGVTALEPDVVLSVTRVVAEMLSVEHEQVALRSLMVIDNQNAIGLLLGEPSSTAEAAKQIGIALSGMRYHWSATAREECEEIIARFVEEYMHMALDECNALCDAAYHAKEAEKVRRRELWAVLDG